MVEIQVGDLSTVLEKSLEKQLKKAKQKGNRNPIATQALKTFDKAYKPQQKGKST